MCDDSHIGLGDPAVFVTDMCVCVCVSQSHNLYNIRRERACACVPCARARVCRAAGRVMNTASSHEFEYDY